MTWTYDVLSAWFRMSSRNGMYRSMWHYLRNKIQWPRRDEWLAMRGKWEILPGTLTDTIRYDTIRYDTIRYDTIRYDTIRYDTIRYDTIRYDTIRYDTIRYDTIRYDTIYLQHLNVTTRMWSRNGSISAFMQDTIARVHS